MKNNPSNKNYIPFTYFLGGSKKKKNTRKKGRKKTVRNRNRKTNKVRYTNKSISKKCICINGECKCIINKSSNTPEGHGFCPHCSPSNVMMRGTDDKLYEIKNSNGMNIWNLL